MNRIVSSNLALACMLSIALARTASAEGVLIANGAGGPLYASIQDAVDAAAEGDVVVVGGGTYAGFTILGKGITVQALAGHAVEIAGTIELRDLPASSSAVLAGLSSRGAQASVESQPGLRIADCAGYVLVQDCTLIGGEGVHMCESIGLGRGGHGALVTSSPRVSFAQSTLQGGRGAWQLTTGCNPCHGGDGGHGLASTSSAVSIYDGTLVGGLGGHDGDVAGRGGDGARISGWGLFAAGSDFRGGDGGDACDFIAPTGGDGGNGLTTSGAQAHILDCTFEAGRPGLAPLGFDGSPGLPTSGTPHFFLPGSARQLFGPAVTSDGSSLRLGYRGLAGDSVYLLVSDAPTFGFEPGASGMLLVPRAVLEAARPIGVVPLGGYLAFGHKLAGLAASASHARLYAQVLARDATGAWFLGSPLALAVLRRGSAPDCDGDGVNDLVALIEGLASDCQGNLVPDSCDLASGQSPDCNANGVPDECDVALGTSLDTDGDGVPDECQASFQTWHVDAGAAPGGNGSAGSPFQHISEGVAAAADGDSVIVAGGVYTGAQNRNVSIGARSILLRSASGPASCVIDCQGLGRAFTLASSYDVSVRIEGFTIRNGSHATRGGAIGAPSSGEFGGEQSLVNCIFEDCSAGSFGGAVGTLYGSLWIVDCTFRGCSANFGGAVDTLGSSVVVLRSAFVGNVAGSQGGAIRLFSPFGDRPQVVSQSVFLENEAGDGGAIFLRGFGWTVNPIPPLWIDQCLIAGNVATRGAGIYADQQQEFSTTLLELTASTVVFNTASQSGGALAIRLGTDALVASSILWGNAAPTGSSIDVNGDAARLYVRFSNLEGGAGSIAPGTGTVSIGPGLLDADPLFADPAGPDGNPATFADNDYRLAAGSPCIDAAETASIAPDLLDLDGDGKSAEPMPFDLDGLPRFVGQTAVDGSGAGAPPLADLGAYERQ